MARSDENEFDPTGSGTLARSWWAARPEEVHTRIAGQASTLVKQNSAWRLNNNAWRHAYNDMQTSLGGNAPMPVVPYAVNQGGITHNVIASCIKSVAAQVFKDPPRVKIQTENGNGKLQRRARKLTQFSDGILDEAGLRVEAPRAGLDALVCGTGFLHVYNDHEGNPVVEHVFPNDVLIDALDGGMMHPTEMMLCGKADRAQLISEFPDLEAKILKASNGPLTNTNRHRTNVTNVGLIEAWHLPQGSTPGRHVICCDTCAFVDEEWDLDMFPVIAIRWDEDQMAFGGTGIAQQLWSLQMHINEMLNIWIESMRMLAMPRIAVEEGSLPPEGQLSNPGAVLTYRPGGNPPQALEFPIMSGDFYAWLDKQHAWAYQLIGLNESSVNATKPADLGSGTALREYRDNQSQRLSAFGERWDRLHIEATKLAIEMTRRYAQQNGGFGKKVKGGKFLGTLTWKDCDIDRDAYSVQAFATNDMPRTPAGKMAKVSELAQAGILDRETMLRLLDMPDIDAETDRMTAAAQRLDLVFANILDDEEYTHPDEYLLAPEHQQMVLTVTRNEVNLAYVNDETPEAIAMLDRFYNECLDLINRMQADQQQKAAAAQALASPQSGAPMARPAPLPVSQLMAQGQAPPQPMPQAA